MRFSAARALAGLALFVVSLCPVVVRAEPPLTDVDAESRLQSMELQGLQRDPFWAHAYWSRSRQAPTVSARVADLRWAIRLDPELFDARWELCWLLLRRHDASFVPELVDTGTRLASSFAGQRRLALVLFTVFGGALLLSLVLLASLAILKNVSRLRHALLERLRFLPGEMRGPAAILTIASPIAISLTLPPTAAAFWGILLGAAATWTFLDRWERRACVTAMTALLVAPIFLSAWTRLVLPVLPTTYLHALWDVQASSDPRAGSVLADLAPPAAHGDPDWFASLALDDRRAGRWAQAEARLQRAIEIAPRQWSYVNNLGNVKLLAGDVDGALEAYSKACTLAPHEPLPRVNEAQAWMRKLEFHKADQALAEASALGFHMPPSSMGSSDKVLVRDQGLDAWSVWRRLALGQGLDQSLPLGRAFSIASGVIFPFRPIWISFPLFLTVWWVALARHLPRVSLCATCGTPICRKCHYRTLRRSLCADCHAIRREVHAPLKRQELLDERRRRKSLVPNLVTLVFAAVLPGSGHVIRGAPRRATGLVLAALCVALAARHGALSGSSFVPAAKQGSIHVALLLYLLLGAISVVGTLRLPVPRVEEDHDDGLAPSTLGRA